MASNRRAYAEDTAVTVSRSRSEMHDLLDGRDADQISIGSDKGRRVDFVTFRLGGICYRMHVRLPGPEDDCILQDSAGRWRSEAQAAAALERETRRRWRVLVMTVKAKLVAAEEGIISLETEWLPYALLPDGRTMGEYMEPQVRKLYATGAMPPLLPWIPPEERQ